MILGMLLASGAPFVLFRIKNMFLIKALGRASWLLTLVPRPSSTCTRILKGNAV